MKRDSRLLPTTSWAFREIPPGLLDGPSFEDQKAIVEGVRKPVLLGAHSDEETAELQFTKCERGDPFLIFEMVSCTAVCDLILDAAAKAHPTITYVRIPSRWTGLLDQRSFQPGA
jgi:hypothetical protein